MSEQDRPLAPGAFRYSSEENGHLSDDQLMKIQRRRRGAICCGCCVATTVVIGLLILILALTVFKVKDPTLTFNSVKIVGLDAAVKNRGSNNSGLNMTFVSDISIKNPNAAGFKFTNATTDLFYNGVLIGEVLSPPGNVGAHKTIHMNVTIDVMVDTVSRVSSFPSDVIAGQMPIGTYTDIRGRVNVLGIKKHVDVELNCTMTVVLATQAITDKVCKQTVHL